MSPGELVGVSLYGQTARGPVPETIPQWLQRYIALSLIEDEVQGDRIGQYTGRK